MIKRHIVWLGLVAAFAAGTAAATAARAETAAEFYKGKELTVYLAGSATGSMNTVTRAMAPFMEKYMPGNPTVIVQAMPGAGGLKATNYVYNAAPKDGTAIGYFLRSIAFSQAIQTKAVRYDANKLNWLGSVGLIRGVISVWHTAPAKSLDDLRKTEVVFGSSGVGSTTFQTPTLMNTYVGTKFKIVTGYGGMGKIQLAMENGEVQSTQIPWDTVRVQKPHWMTDKLVVPIAISGMTRSKSLPNVPTMVELAQTEEGRAVLEAYSLPEATGRLFAAPPGVPADRLAALRDAFAKTVNDPEFVKAADKYGFEAELIDHREVAELVNRTVNTKPEVIAKLREIFGDNVGGE